MLRGKPWESEKLKAWKWYLLSVSVFLLLIGAFLIIA